MADRTEVTQCQALGGAPETRKAVLTAPKRIWLQISDEEEHYDEPFQSDEVTWCQDSVVACEVEYVRADLATNAPPLSDERQREATSAAAPNSSEAAVPLITERGA